MAVLLAELFLKLSGYDELHGPSYSPQLSASWNLHILALLDGRCMCFRHDRQGVWGSCVKVRQSSSGEYQAEGTGCKDAAAGCWTGPPIRLEGECLSAVSNRLSESCQKDNALHHFHAMVSAVAKSLRNWRGNTCAQPFLQRKRSLQC